MCPSCLGVLSPYPLVISQVRGSESKSAQRKGGRGLKTIHLSGRMYYEIIPNLLCPSNPYSPILVERPGIGLPESVRRNRTKLACNLYVAASFIWVGLILNGGKRAAHIHCSVTSRLVIQYNLRKC